MNILIIDDNDDKRLDVKQVLAESFQVRPPKVAEAKNYDEALEALREAQFDLVILDLMLPGPGHGPDSAYSAAIMTNLLQGTAKFPPAHIIGLTAFADEAEKATQLYEENLLSLEIYSPDDRAWADRLIAKIRYLIKSKQAAMLFQANSYDYDIVILTARYENEYVPITKYLLKDVQETEHPLWDGFISFGSIKTPHKTLRAVMCCIGEMGMAPAAAVTSQAVALFRPRLIAMLGMCCGFSDATKCSSPRKLMDVIVAREVSCWEEGRYQDRAKNRPDFMNRSKARLIDDRIRQYVSDAIEAGAEAIVPALTKFAATPAYRAVISHFGEGVVREVPEAKFAPLVSGSSVIADRGTIDEILERHPNAVGLDMELYGVYCAVERSIGKRPSVMGIKGVADFGVVDKDDKAQIGASKLSAEVFRSLLPSLPIWK